MWQISLTVNRTENMNQYVIEADCGPIQVVAESDIAAVVQAKEYLKRRGFRGYDLFRYPKCWVERPSAGLIWVPLFNFVP